MNNAAISVIVPVNDLESQTIAAWTKVAGCHVIDRELPWGSGIAAAQIDIQAL